jgi:secretion/DNA translocation related CpaE-like protein
MKERSMARSTEVPRVALITGDQDVVDQVADATAAAGVPLDVGLAMDMVRQRHRAVLIGVDAASGLARARLPGRGAAMLVGSDAAIDQLWKWAGELGAVAAVSLPSGSAWLVQWLHQRSRPEAGLECVVSAVFGAAGGVGASTLAAALAVTASQSGLRPLLIDAHPGPAGVDLLLTTEPVPSPWARFAGIRGFLAPQSLEGLPQWEGVRCLGWGGETDVPLWQGALASVLAAAARDHELVVLDAGGTVLDCAELPGRTRAVLVAPGSWRGVAAAQSRLAVLRDAFDEPPIVVLRDVGGRTDPRGWLKQFPETNVKVLEFDPSVLDDEDQGRPPGTRRRSGPARVARELLALLAEPAIAA